MISIDFKGKRFNYRVAGVLLRDGKVLLHKEGRDQYWYLPGGRCELMETSSDTLVREFMEEANATVRVERLLWVIENFYEARGEAFHEIGLYYLIHSENINTNDEFEGIEINGNTLYFKWFRIDELDQVRVLPDTLREQLKDISPNICHVINKEI